MKIRAEHIRLIVVLTLAIYLVYRFTTYWDSTFFGDVFLDLALGTVILTLLAWPILSSALRGIELKMMTKFLIPSIALFAGLAILGIRFVKNQTFDKPTMLRIQYAGDLNALSVDFKVDGTYILDNSSWGGSRFTYGTYELRDETVILDRDSIDNVIKSSRLKIGKEQEYGSSNVRFVEQVDVNGNRLDSWLKFRLVVDNRK